MKGILAITVLLVVCGVAACAPQPTAPSPTPPATLAQPTATIAPTATAAPTREPRQPILRIGLPHYPSTLDPQRAGDRAEMTVLRQTYEGLLRVDEKGNIGPGSADRCEFDSASKSLTFHIREGLKRSDGTPLTARDFEYALKRAADPRLADRPYATLLSDVKGAADLEGLDPKKTKSDVIDKALAGLGIKATDDSNLVVTFVAPTGYWPVIATTWIAFPVDKRRVDADPETWWTKAEAHVGNGPFVLGSIEQGKKIVLVPNVHYWQGKPKLERIELVYNSDPQVLLDAYRKGDLEIHAALAPDSIAAISADTSLKNELLRYPAAVTTGFAFNVTKKPFTDANVRKAFSMAIDRAGLIRDTAKGIGIPYTRWIPPGVPGAQTTLAGVPGYDPKAALKLLVDNGYAAKESTADAPKVDCAKLGPIRLVYRAGAANSTRFRYLADNLTAALACQIALEPVEPAAYTAMMADPKTVPAISLQVWMQDYAHPQNWLGDYWTCGAYADRYGQCTKTYDAFVQKAAQEPDSAKALTLYQQAEEQLLKQVPAAFTSHGESIYLVKPYVKGPREHTGSDDLQWAGEWGPTWTYDLDR